MGQALEIDMKMGETFWVDGKGKSWQNWQGKDKQTKTRRLKIKFLVN